MSELDGSDACARSKCWSARRWPAAACWSLTYHVIYERRLAPETPPVPVKST